MSESSWLFKPSKVKERNYNAAFVVGFIIGIVTIFVKWGAGNAIPPFPVGHTAPPVLLMEWFGFKGPMYTFLGHGLPWGMIVHGLTGICFGLFYTLVSEKFPRLRMWRGVIYGIAIAIVFHGILLPLMGMQPFAWESGDWFLSLISEIISTSATMWVIHEMQYSLRIAMYKKPPADFED